MPLRECMEKHTQREYKDWMIWLDEEWNNPSRTDYHLMRISQRILQSQSTKPNKVTLEDQKVPFTLVKNTKQSKEEQGKLQAAKSKQIWMSFVKKFESKE